MFGNIGLDYIKLNLCCISIDILYNNQIIDDMLLINNCVNRYNILLNNYLI